MTTRLHTLGFTILGLGLAGCGGAYDEGPGANTPQVEYANAQAQANVETVATTSDEVYIGEQADAYEDTDPTAVTEFRTTLDPYGTWAEDDNYGTVWVPSTAVVGADFAPYVSAGHWAYGDDYVWVSDYDWGWAPFHYGRWVWIGGRGWSWIPGRRYAGAWVTWRTGYDGWGYVGWAPLAPTWYWHGGYAYHLGWTPPTPYVFCAHEHLFTPNVGTRIVAGAQVAAVGQHTRPYTPATPGVGGTNPGPGRSIGGPPPGQMGINNAPAPPSGHAGLMRAQGYATPSTATQLGARPPSLGSAAHASIGSNTIPNRTSASSYGGSNNGRLLGSSYVPPPRPYTPSHNMPQQLPYRNPQNMPQQIPHSSYGSSYGSQPYYSTSPHYQPSPSGSMPHYSPSPSGSMPHYSPSPSYGSSQPSYGGSSSFGGGSSSFSHAAPSGGGGWGSSSHSAPSGGFSGGSSHSSGGGGRMGGGGGRGGGGGHR